MLGSCLGFLIVYYSSLEVRDESLIQLPWLSEVVSVSLLWISSASFPTYVINVAT